MTTRNKRRIVMFAIFACGLWAVWNIIQWKNPQIIDIEEQGASIQIEVAADVQNPWENCFNANWNMEGISSLHVNDSGKIGLYSELYCDTETLNFVVEFDDGSRSLYTFSSLRSLQSWISPPVIVALVVLVIFILVSVIPDDTLLRILRMAAVPAMIILGILVAVVMVEISLRVIYPTQIPQDVYEVYHFKPDKDVGWINREGFEFDWKGRNPHCVEFNAHVKYNEWGFRDDDWTISKPEGTIRIALIGDSHIEAKQVDFADTAAEVLQKRLEQGFPELKFEVMNFGVSNFSVGQYNLLYDHYVRQFQPDYVFVYVAYFQVLRNQSGYVYSRNETYSLEIRPTYVLDTSGNLQLVPPSEFEKFQDVARSWISLFDEINPLSATMIERLVKQQLITQPTSIHPVDDVPLPNTDFPQVDVYFAILDEMATKLQDNHTKMILVDVFDYFEYVAEPAGSGVLAEQNQDFAETHDIGYIDLSSIFRASQESIQFPCDAHLNVNGNRIFAEAMFSWLQAELDG